MDAAIFLNKRIQCANTLYRSLKCLFIVFIATTTTLLSYTRPWTATFFNVFMLISIILNLNKAMAMRFSQNKA